MTERKFHKELMRLTCYYRHRSNVPTGDGAVTNTWYQFLSGQDEEWFTKVVTFYMLTHEEGPKSPTDLLNSSHLLKTAEIALNPKSEI